MEEAAENLGCTGMRKLCRITLPLIMPGMFAGGTIVFIWAFTDLGTPLEFAYVASRDFNVYAVDTLKGRLIWKMTGGAPIHRKPEVTDEDVYVAADREGLSRINRLSGDQVWRNREADQFLACNKKFVYATDRKGQLLVLDKVRGTTLSGYDTRDFVSTVRELGVTPHVARRQHGAIDERTSRHPGYAISLSKRWLVEKPFGWLKQIGPLKKVKLRGLAKVDWLFVFSCAVFNLIRIPKLRAQSA